MFSVRYCTPQQSHNTFITVLFFPYSTPPKQSYFPTPSTLLTIVSIIVLTNEPMFFSFLVISVWLAMRSWRNRVRREERWWRVSRDGSEKMLSVFSNFFQTSTVYKNKTDSVLSNLLLLINYFPIWSFLKQIARQTVISKQIWVTCLS